MAMPTLLDIAVQNGSDGVAGLIDETAKAHPEIAVGYARTIRGMHYKTRVRTVLQAGAFRAANTGTAVGKSSYENRLYETYIWNPQWECDKAVADRDEDGAAAYIALEAQGIVESTMQSMCTQFYYGTTSPGDSLGFPGLLSAYDSTNMVVDAGGTTAATGSSVWLVKFGPKDVAWVYGDNGSIVMSPVTEQRLTDSNSNPYTAYRQEMLAYPGLQVGSPRNSIARIKKLTADSGKGLTDSLLGDAIALFPAGFIPDAIFMTRRSRNQLRKSRTATNAVGQPAPTPTDWEGIPIYVTDALSNTEALTL